MSRRAVVEQLGDPRVRPDEHGRVDECEHAQAPVDVLDLVARRPAQARLQREQEHELPERGGEHAQARVRPGDFEREQRDDRDHDHRRREPRLRALAPERPETEQQAGAARAEREVVADDADGVPDAVRRDREQEQRGAVEQEARRPQARTRALLVPATDVHEQAREHDLHQAAAEGEGGNVDRKEGGIRHAAGTPGTGSRGFRRRHYASSVVALKPDAAAKHIAASAAPTVGAHPVRDRGVHAAAW
jgi:hypothetical protein